MTKFIILFILSALTTLPALANFAWDTQVKMANGELKIIHKIGRGDEIADLDSKSTMGKISQGSAVVGFSTSAPSSSITKMIYIGFEADKGLRTIVVSDDQVFLTASGKFKRAKELSPDTDKLLSETGVPLNIKSILYNAYAGDIHSISSESDLSPDNCFIANGVWVGSHKFQVYWDDGSIGKADIFDDFPLNRKL